MDGFGIARGLDLVPLPAGVEDRWEGKQGWRQRGLGGLQALLCGPQRALLVGKWPMLLGWAAAEFV